MSIDDYDVNFIENNPWQTRSREPDPEYIKDLAEDIQKNGLLQVPIGRIVDGKVQLAFGHNRLRAFRELKIPFMPVDVRELSDEQMAAFAWSENEKRRDVTAIERARAIQQRIVDFKWSNRQAAEALGVDHSTISNMLRLLKLPEEIQNANLEGKLSERQMEALLPLFEMPECVDRFIGFYYYGSAGHNHFTAANIPIYAIDEGWPSDFIRKIIDAYIKNFSQELSKTEFKLDQLIPEENGVYCGLCKTCDRRMASRNLCFDKGCFEAKTNYMRRQYLIKANKASGYDLIDETKGGQTTDLPHYDWEKETRERILATKCPNLRLEYTLQEVKDIPGFPHAIIVCDKRNNSCTCIKGLGAMKREKSQQPSRPLADVIFDDFTKSVDVEEPEEEELEEEEEEENPSSETLSPEGEREKKAITSMELEEAARQARRGKIELTKKTEEIQAKLENHLLEEARILSPGVFYLALHRYSWPSEKELILENNFAYMAREGARILIDHSSVDTMDGLIRLINDQLKRLQLRPFSLEEKLSQPVQMARDGSAFPEL